MRPNPQFPLPNSRLLIPMLMIIAGLLAFNAIAADVSYHGLLSRVDHDLAPFLHNHTQGWAIFLFSGISGLGELKLVLSVALGFGGFLIFRRRWRALTVWTLGLFGCGFINAKLKDAFAIPRPERFTVYDFGDYPGYSFPSGHTMAVTVTAGLLALIYFHQKPLPAPRRWAIGLLAAAIGTLEAFALLYIGVHYLTDVLAALALSLAWLGIMRLLLPPAKLTTKTSQLTNEVNL